MLCEVGRAGRASEVWSGGGIRGWGCPWGGGGGALRFAWVPTAQWPLGAEVVNAKVSGRSTPFGAKKGGGQLETKNITGAVAYKFCLLSLHFIKYVVFLV